MKATILCGALAAVVLTAAAHADFNAALAEYRDGHYDSARRQFTAMAELGDCSSQFNLGVMVLQGQGGAKDVGGGVGWLAHGVAASPSAFQNFTEDALDAHRKYVVEHLEDMPVIRNWKWTPD